MSHHSPSAQKRAAQVERILRGFVVEGKIPIATLPKASRAASKGITNIWSAHECRMYAYQNRLVDKNQYESMYYCQRKQQK